MKEYEVKSTVDFKGVGEWFENELGIRKAKIYTKEGLGKFVVTFIDYEKYKTQKQNRTFHALLSLFFRSGCFSHNAKTVDDLKDYYKHKVGMIDYYLYFNGEVLVRAKMVEDIPAYVSRTNACRIILKSWSKATKKQAREAIDLLVKEMQESGINQTSYAKEFNKIMEELEK